jgi:recombination associated protein RdgC
MPVRRGSVSFARFRAASDKPKSKDPRRSLAAALRKRAFEPLDREGEEDRAAGWVELDDPDSAALAPGSFLFGDHVVVTWRVDALRIPAAMVRAEVDAWAKVHEAKHGQPPRRQEKKAQKELVLRKLRRQAFMSTKTFDVSWNAGTDHVEIWATSAKVIEEIQVAFEETFGVHLVPRSPGALAGEAGVDVSTIEPTAALFGTDVATEARAHVES